MPDETAVLEVAGKDFANWTGLTIQRSLEDIADAFSFSVPFDPTRPDMVEAFRPFGYQLARIKVDDELLITGRMEQPTTATDATGRTINVQGRSFAGSMIDCPFDPPYQFDGQTWLRIAGAIAGQFSVPIDRSVDTGAIKEARASTGDEAGAFLSTLAKGEGYRMISDAQGRIKLLKIRRTPPVASIVEGVGSFVSASLVANGTARYSKTKAIKTMGGWPDKTETSIDPAIKIFRPRIITADGSPQSVQAAADLARSQSIAESCPVDVVVTGWKTDSGHVWDKGDFVTLHAPGAFILREWEFVVQSVTFELTDGGRASTLRLVFPEAYLGGTPGSYPWD